ncbi:MAG TPA: carboxymuconolactone decarboxylase family protein [Pseudomonadales bacterium]|nr:carboxymuconolactone decarboxylase family protein [Pseudomonadales bacterium]
MLSPSRIPLLSKEEALQRGRELGISDYIAQMNIFRVLLNHPKMAGELNSTIIQLVSGDKAVSDRLREIIIMRVSWKACCDYEWSQHWMASLFFGLSEQELYSLRHWQASDCFNEAEKTVLAATDALLDNRKIPDHIWQQLKTFFGTDKALIEVVTCIGNWHMFALILNALEVPLDEGMSSWPPDGIAPGKASSP